MSSRTDTFDIGALRLLPGEGRQLDLDIQVEPYELGGHTYSVTRQVEAAPEVEAASENEAAPEVAVRAAPRTDGVPAGLIPARLGISRMSGQGYALHLTFSADLHGPCMRCLEPADPQFRVDAREISQPDTDEPEQSTELVSPYVVDAVLDVNAWARDALALVLPAALLHAPDCLGLCPICGIDLNTAGPEHVHEREPDLRWAALAELKLEGSDPLAREPMSGDADGVESPDPDTSADSGVEATSGQD